MGMTKAAVTNIAGKRNRSVYKKRGGFKINAGKIFTKKRWMEKLTGRESVGAWQRNFQTVTWENSLSEEFEMGHKMI